uniref:Uncharacterized protein n=1 Tax=Anopheles funestus TaxID=62324 RepID=A0A182RU16_ANOFN
MRLCANVKFDEYCVIGLFSTLLSMTVLCSSVTLKCIYNQQDARTIPDDFEDMIGYGWFDIEVVHLFSIGDLFYGIRSKIRFCLIRFMIVVFEWIARISNTRKGSPLYQVWERKDMPMAKGRHCGWLWSPSVHLVGLLRIATASIVASVLLVNDFQKAGQLSLYRNVTIDIIFAILVVITYLTIGIRGSEYYIIVGILLLLDMGTCGEVATNLSSRRPKLQRTRATVETFMFGYMLLTVDLFRIQSRRTERLRGYLILSSSEHNM